MSGPIHDRLVEGRPTFQRGLLGIENLDQIADLDLTDCEVGIQVADDGRLWVCVGGFALIRFKPTDITH